jgi:prolyl-tRNA synthetase
MVATVTEGTEDHDEFVFAVVRGDMELNETKLANALKAKELRPATDDEIKAHNAVPGYASPMGVKDATILVDDLVTESPNLVAGANEEGFHLRNVNYGRDFKADIVTDLAAAEEESPCPECGHPMHTIRGVEVGNIFKLGTRYSDSMGCTFLDKDGEEKAVIMGSYGIGSGRLLASVAEEYNDPNGLIWPISIAPYPVHLVVLSGAEDEGEEAFHQLQDAGIEALYDDRDETPGVKFADADLIGLPIRLTVSKRSLKNGGVELKLRSEEEAEVVAMEKLIETVQSKIEALEAGIADKVVEMPFED